jgi:hypothetical protein
LLESSKVFAMLPRKVPSMVLFKNAFKLKKTWDLNYTWLLFGDTNVSVHSMISLST